MKIIKKNIDEKFIKIPSEWMGDEDALLDKYGEFSYAFYIYCLMHQLKFYDGKCIFSMDGFLDLFGMTQYREKKRRAKDHLIKSIIKLEEDNMVKFYSDMGFSSIINFNEYKHDVGEIYYIKLKSNESNKFFKLYFDEIIKITTVKDSVSAISLLAHFSLLMSCINNKTSLAYISIESISELLCVGRNTCIKNNKTLNDLKLIYYESAGLLHLDKDYVKSYPNTYARYCNRGLVDDYVESQRARFKGRLTNSSKERQERANRRTGLKHRLNNLNKRRDSIGLTHDEELEYIEKQEEYNMLVKIREKELEENA